MTWKFANQAGTVVSRDAGGGMTQSCLISAQEVQDYLASGGVIAPYVAPPAIPVTEVTMAQCRKQLVLAGVDLSGIAQIFANMPQPQGQLAAIDWEFAPIVHIDNPLVVAVSVSRGWTTEQLQTMFNDASKL
jgi:hypothetical protein